jgi:hypothetical protein
MLRDGRVGNRHRRNADSNSFGNADSDGNPDRDANSNCNPDRNANPNRNGDTNSKRNAYSVAFADCYTESHPDTQSDASAGA